MHDTDAIISYVRLRAAYDAAHRRLDSYIATVEAVVRPLNESLDANLMAPERWPSLEDIATGQNEIRRLRRDMQEPWDLVPDHLRLALVPPPHGEPKRLARS